MKPILIVEDEVKLAQLLADYLQHAGFNPSMLHEGTEVVAWVKANQPELILLDLMVPGMDGLEICKAIRSFSNVPIIMVTARVDEIDRLLGLELGADDYICKPYSPREVVARVKAVLRRIHPQPNTETTASPLQLDAEQLSATYFNEPVPLTAIEFKLLQILVDKPGRIFNRQQLMERIYEDHRIVSDRTIDSHIKKIRKKLALIHDEQEIIHSVYGAGYTFRE
ncbi:response regulator [Spartinivicinus poritis]|uniref:Response regulator n=1 Tax=Spartinivicinus poritis TaxID=2994640 RepID=A0ABT5U8K1_9GAMM|nr:response regulator [Spartinivicinus sp. A2-2]MDE1462701.1 response regulator [Spartinivicinus sp. A2-2]